MVDKLKIDYDIDRQENVWIHPDPVLRAIEIFKYHPSILKFKEFMNDKGMSFFFSYTTLEKKIQCTEKLRYEKNMSRKWYPCENNKIALWYIFLLHTS